ncbi:MAG: hypothetical protein ICV61_09080, partial [Microcoleus sp. Co-bin12]|nr:hypothetical protein [Microcoleus sp. Co-bin12]
SGDYDHQAEIEIILLLVEGTDVESTYVEENFHTVKLSRFVSMGSLVSAFFCQIV